MAKLQKQIEADINMQFDQPKISIKKKKKKVYKKFVSVPSEELKIEEIKLNFDKLIRLETITNI